METDLLILVKTVTMAWMMELAALQVAPPALLSDMIAQTQEPGLFLTVQKNAEIIWKLEVKSVMMATQMLD